MKWDHLKKAKSSKENERFKYVFIQPDQTKTERENRKKKVAELKEKRLPSTKYEIKGNQSVENRVLWLTICLWNVEGAKGTLSLCTSEAIAYDILILTETFSLNSVEILGFTCFCTKAIKNGRGDRKAA